MQRFCSHSGEQRIQRSMPRSLAALVLLLSLVTVTGVSLLPAPAGAQEYATDTDVRVTQVDTSGYPEVTLYVAVQNAAGKPMLNLTRNDFTITEDGQPVTLTDFHGVGAPVSTVLVLDRSGSMSEDDKLEGAQEAALTFIDQMRRGDQTALIVFSQETMVLQDFTQEKEELEEAVERLDTRGGTAIYDSMIEGIDILSGVSGRRVLLLLTDGSDCRDLEIMSCPRDMGSMHSLEDAIAYANRDEQPVYVVGLGDRDVSNEDHSGINEAVLRKIARETYGAYFYAPDGDELVALYNNLASELQSEYMLTYTSPRPSYDGTRRDIRVHVGTTTSTSSYTERHLINVDSNAVVGVLLLLPLMALLFLPGVAVRNGWKIAPGQRQRRSTMPADSSITPASEPAAAARCCVVCGAALLNDASFCTECGASQAATPSPSALAEEGVCISCGYQLRPGARFCGKCGMQQPTEHSTEEGPR